MNSDYTDEYILDLIFTQLNIFKLTNDEAILVNDIFKQVKERTTYCFSHSKNKYYNRDGEVYFDPFHTGQWTIFLYFLSNSLFKEEQTNIALCYKVYYLNKMLNSCDLFYEVNLPDIFFLDHPLGTVIGRGTFGNYFSFTQGCTIGNNKGFFPIIGERVSMLSNSKILGKSMIGDNVIISANTYIKDTDIPDNSIVFGSSPNLIIKENNLTIK